MSCFVGAFRTKRRRASQRLGFFCPHGPGAQVTPQSPVENSATVIDSEGHELMECNCRAWHDPHGPKSPLRVLMWVELGAVGADTPAAFPIAVCSGKGPASVAG